MHRADFEEQRPTPFETTLWSLVAAAVVATAIAVAPGSFDTFRTPKTVIFQLLALLIFAVGGAAMLLSDRVARTFHTNRTALVITLSAVAWTALSSATSLKPAVSHLKPFSIFCFAVFFIAALWTSRRRGPLAVVIVLAPAVLNAITAFMQSFGKWTMWFVPSELDARLRTTAFIGTANEVGGYLVLPLIAAIAAAIAFARLRWVFGAAAAVIAIGVVAAQSVTSIVAAVCGVAAITLLPGARRVRWFAAIALVLFVSVVALHPGSRARMRTMMSFASGGQLSEMTSFRLPAYSAAITMFRERPLAGVGPGVFRALYLPYKLRLDADHPQWIRLGNQSFGQVHNDHLQILAETGLPGYLLFLAALAFVARLSFVRRDETDGRTRFVTSFAFPGVVALFVLALAHFPLQLTSHMIPAVYLAALCIAWKEPDASA
ncbi:MAG: O-antigen ligase family protein [Acidobacteriota bacterium]|nr:O-antigen ligase family protein [Acidobacteriota bacterium]